MKVASSLLLAAAAAQPKPPPTLGLTVQAFLGYKNACDYVEVRPANLYLSIFDADAQTITNSEPSTLSIPSTAICSYTTRVAVNGSAAWATFADCSMQKPVWFTAAWSLSGPKPAYLGACAHDGAYSSFYDERIVLGGPYFIRSSDAAIVVYSSPEGGAYASATTTLQLPPCDYKEIGNLPTSVAAGPNREHDISSALIELAYKRSVASLDSVLARLNYSAGSPWAIIPDDSTNKSSPPQFLSIGFTTKIDNGNKFNVTAFDPANNYAQLWSSLWTCGAPIAYVCPDALALRRMYNRRVLTVGYDYRTPTFSMGFHAWANASNPAMYFLTPNFPGLGVSDGTLWMDSGDSSSGSSGSSSGWPLYLAQRLSDNMSCHDTTQGNTTLQVVTVASEDDFGVSASVPLPYCPLPGPAACAAVVYEQMQRPAGP